MLGVVVLCALPLAVPAPGAGSVAGAVYAGVAARDPALDAPAERMAIALGQVLERRGAVDLGSPPLPDADDGKDAILDGLVSAAKSRYLEGDFAGAVDKTTEAVSRFESAGAFRPGPAWSTWQTALIVRSLALSRLDREADADAALATLAATLPKAEPDPGLTPPKTVQRFEQIRDELKKKPAGSIAVTSTPPGADVVVDGVSQGKAPVVVRDLLPGAHFVALSSEGARVERRVELAAGAEARLDEKVGDPRAAAARALRALLTTAAPAEALVDKAKAVGDDVIVGALVPGARDLPDSALLVVARVRGGSVVVTGARLDYKPTVHARADALAAALVAGGEGWLGPGHRTARPVELLTAGEPSGTASADPPLPPPPDAGDGNNLWLYAGVGAAVAVVAAGAAVGVALATTRSSLQVKVDASLLTRR